VALRGRAKVAVMAAMSTKSRQVIYGGRIIGAKIRAEGAREAAQKAVREADRAAAELWSIQMEAYGGPAQPSPTIAQCLNGGYGFDEHNSERLNLRKYLAHSATPGYYLVAFTNYQDINQINKRASKVLYGNPQGWQPGKVAMQDRYEKSIRNTYDALAMDFDLAE
jgi:hypothetical protein